MRKQPEFNKEYNFQDKIERLKSLNELLKSNVISQEEFDTLKNEILINTGSNIKGEELHNQAKSKFRQFNKNQKIFLSLLSFIFCLWLYANIFFDTSDLMNTSEGKKPFDFTAMMVLFKYYGFCRSNIDPTYLKAYFPSFLKVEEPNLNDCDKVNQLYLSSNDLPAQSGIAFNNGEYEKYKIIYKNSDHDLDGDGVKDNIIVYILDNKFFDTNDLDDNDNYKAKIVINNISVDYSFYWKEKAYFGQIDYQILNVSKLNKEFIIRQKEPEHEDPATETSIVRYINCKTLTCTRIKGHGYNAGLFENIGNNNFSIKTDSRFNDKEYYSLTETGVKLLRKTTAKRPLGYIPAACPFVYNINSDGKSTLKGEILRNIIGSKNITWQSLYIGKTNDSLLSIKISEEKEEITHIDSIRLIESGHFIYPENWKSGTSKNILHKGENILLNFKVNKSSKPLKLECKGFYVLDKK